jgi:pectate lyase
MASALARSAAAAVLACAWACSDAATEPNRPSGDVQVAPMAPPAAGADSNGGMVPPGNMAADAAGASVGDPGAAGLGDPAAGDGEQPTDPQAADSGGAGSGSAMEMGTDGSPGAGSDAGTDAPVPPSTDGPIGFASLNGGTVGGAGGEMVTARSYDELRSHASGDDPKIIMVRGTIDNGSSGGVISVGSNKSIIGVGSTAFLDRVVISIRDESNIIIQNLKISLVGHSEPTSINDGDDISISGSSTNIWIDHCELYSEDPSEQTDIDFYDGLLDIKNSSGYITVSWNYAHDHHKGFLVGSSATDLYDERKITYHHNHFARVRKRTPTYRGAVGHVFNNYITEADQATFAMTGTCLRVERNFYENQVVEMFSIFTNNAEPGEAEVIENYIAGGNNRDFPPPCTADIPYAYADVLIENAEEVKAVVIAGAGVGKL